MTEAKTQKDWYGWWFAPHNEMLGYGDLRPVSVGAVHRVGGTVQLCSHGLHAAPTVLEACGYARLTVPPILYRVALRGGIKHYHDKSVANEREYLYRIDAGKVLTEFARECLWAVLGRWNDCPKPVHDFTRCWGPITDNLRETCMTLRNPHDKQATAVWHIMRLVAQSEVIRPAVIVDIATRIRNIVCDGIDLYDLRATVRAITGKRLDTLMCKAMREEWSRANQQSVVDLAQQEFKQRLESMKTL